MTSFKSKYWIKINILFEIKASNLYHGRSDDNGFSNGNNKLNISSKTVWMRSAF